MIYSKKLQANIPVKVESKSSELKQFGRFTKYTIKDNKIPVGTVDVLDTENGIQVKFIKNNFPELYSGFGKVADQLEVEHCLNRGLEDFEIVSEAALNSHALHYLRGKRFNSKTVENKIKEVIANTPKGEMYNTAFLGSVSMYMPKELIKKYVELIRKNPLILR